MRNMICILLLLAGIKMSAQEPAMSRITREFTYQGRPVSPKALVYMFPNQQNATTMDVIDLRQFPLADKGQKDTTNAFPFIKDPKAHAHSEWLRYSSLNLDTINTKNPDNMRGHLSYIQLGNTTGGNFIILAYLNGSNTLDQAAIFILDIQGNKLINKKTFLEARKAFGSPVEIKDGVIINGANKYVIPVSAR